MPPPPLIGLSGQPMSYSDVGAALLQNSLSSYSTNIVEDAYLNKQITTLLIILDKLSLLEKAIILCFQGLGSDDIIERSKHGNKSNKHLLLLQQITSITVLLCREVIQILNLKMMNKKKLQKENLIVQNKKVQYGKN